MGVVEGEWRTSRRSSCCATSAMPATGELQAFLQPSPPPPESEKTLLWTLADGQGLLMGLSPRYLDTFRTTTHIPVE